MKRAFLLALLGLHGWINVFAEGQVHSPRPAGSIGVFAHRDGLVQEAIICLGRAETLVVAIEFLGMDNPQLTGAEFRITGFPEDWTVTAEPLGPTPLTLGNPLTGRGNVAYPVCHESTSVILVYRVIVFARLEGEATLSVEAGNPPSNPHYRSPVAVLCDAPVYTAVALRGGTLHLTARECAV